MQYMWIVVPRYPFP